MNKYSPKGTGNTEQIFLSLYDGKSIDVARKKDCDIHLKKTSLSILGGIQPSVFSTLIDKEIDNGFWARFNFLCLENTQLPPIDWDVNPNNLENCLYSLYKNLDSLTGKIYGLEIAARPIWDKWHIETEESRLTGKHPLLRSLYPKALSLIHI